MNLFKKFMTGVAVGAMALVVAGSTGMTTADAAAIKAGDITVDYEEATITVKSADKELLVGYPKVKVNESDASASTVKVSSWDVYAGNTKGTTIDISSLNLTKENYVAIKGTTNTDPVLVKLSVIDKAIKVKYDKNTGAMSITASTEAVPAMQYRTTTGAWKEVTEDTNYTLYQQQGATLYFRAMPDEAAAVTAADGAVANYAVYEAKGAFAGKEAKVKVSKLSNGPKVAVNYEKNTITIPKGVKYDIYTSKTTAGADEWKDAADKVVETLVPTEDGLEAGLVAVKKVAEGKLDSKVTIFAYNAVAALEIGKELDDITAYTNIDDNNAIKIENVVSKDNKTTAVKVTNGNEAAGATYQVIVAEAEMEQAGLAASTTAKTIKPGKNATIKCAAGQSVYVRIAGDKKAETFASNYVCLGSVADPAVEEEE